MTRPDLAWSYSEVSKYIQCPGQPHMDAALHVLRYLRGTCDRAISTNMSMRLQTLCGAGLILTGQLMLILDAVMMGHLIILNGGAVSWKSRLKTLCPFLPLKPNTLLLIIAARRCATRGKSFATLGLPKLPRQRSTRISSHVLPCPKILSVEIFLSTLISFAARTLRRTVGGGMILLSLPYSSLIVSCRDRRLARRSLSWFSLLIFG
jgi:hypothetical protein